MWQNLVGLSFVWEAWQWRKMLNFHRVGQSAPTDRSRPLPLLHKYAFQARIAKQTNFHIIETSGSIRIKPHFAQ